MALNTNKPFATRKLQKLNEETGELCVKINTEVDHDVHYAMSRRRNKQNGRRAREWIYDLYIVRVHELTLMGIIHIIHRLIKVPQMLIDKLRIVQRQLSVISNKNIG